MLKFIGFIALIMWVAQYGRPVSRAFAQLNSANANDRQKPKVTKLSSGKIKLDIDHSSKGNVTAVCDAKHDTTIIDPDPERPKTKVVYHNCELTYDIR
jgi:hypothetical protein